MLKLVDYNFDPVKEVLRIEVHVSPDFPAQEELYTELLSKNFTSRVEVIPSGSSGDLIVEVFPVGSQRDARVDNELPGSPIDKPIIDNSIPGAPKRPVYPDNSLPAPPLKPENELPKPPNEIDNSLPHPKPGLPGNELPNKPDQGLPIGGTKPPEIGLPKPNPAPKK